MMNKNYQHYVQISRLIHQSSGQKVDCDVRVTGISIDSRKVSPGHAFCALKGEANNGCDFINQAIYKGASVVLTDQKLSLQKFPLETPVIHVPKLKECLGTMVDIFYCHPSSHLQTIGITGTNGKTSVAYMISDALERLGKKVAYSGTLGMGFLSNEIIQSGMTTPDVVTLHQWLGQMSQKGADFVTMEVSSHAIMQKRVDAIRFDTAVFTNLSSEHLDYHKTLKEYAECKKSLFKDSSLNCIVVNSDDLIGQEIIKEHQQRCRLFAYGSREHQSQGIQSIFVKEYLQRDRGIKCLVHTPAGNGWIDSPLQGHFNLENLLAALSVLIQYDVPMDDALNALNCFSGVPGRMEYYGGKGRPHVYVDYAHTPDALTKVLSALKSTCKGSLWCVFGAGGDRDSSKRPLMGSAAERYSDRIILTNDNPRSEPPQIIVDDILSGMICGWACEVEFGRSAAIAQAISQAKSDDVILIAGKGHEKYQEINGQRHYFSDSDVVQLQLSLYEGVI